MASPHRTESDGAIDATYNKQGLDHVPGEAGGLLLDLGGAFDILAHMPRRPKAPASRRPPCTDQYL